MSVLALPAGPALPQLPALPPRRRHLTLVPALPETPPAGEAEAAGVAGPARPARAARRVEVDEASPLRLTVRGRRVLVAGVLALAAVAGGVLGAVASSATPAPVDVERVTVAPGESLWSVAVAAAGSSADVRETMSQIVALNDLEGDTIHAGQELLVPERG